MNWISLFISDLHKRIRDQFMLHFFFLHRARIWLGVHEIMGTWDPTSYPGKKIIDEQQKRRRKKANLWPNLLRVLPEFARISPKFCPNFAQNFARILTSGFFSGGGGGGSAPLPSVSYAYVSERIWLYFHHIIRDL